MILFSHLRFRKLHPEELEGHPFKMPGAKYDHLTLILKYQYCLVRYFMLNYNISANLVSFS